MQRPFMRIPYTGALPPPRIIPSRATSPAAAVLALANFLAPTTTRPQLSRLRNSADDNERRASTVILSGAGISVASGLADYRGAGGTYTLNKTYRPIYYSEFCENHEARKRYWARSFLGWTTLNRARPNAAHNAVRDLGDLGLVKSVITQNVDSFHSISHPTLSTLELHGFLRSLVCLSCRRLYSRAEFQKQLSSLNPAWADFLASALASGALDTENPQERRAKGMKTNPDGDVDLPDAPYSTFRYPPCPTCLRNPPLGKDGRPSRVETDEDGAWKQRSTAGVLKPAVTMFGESIDADVKVAAEKAVSDADRLLVIGSSLATYSAWRLVKRAKELGMPIGVLNLGGVRGEEELYASIGGEDDGTDGVRIGLPVQQVLPGVVETLRNRLPSTNIDRGNRSTASVF